MEKTCFKCGETKPFREFYRHNAMSGGRLNKCIDCTKLDAKNHRLLNLDRIRAYDRERGNRQSAEYLANYRKRYPRKYKAHNAVNNAIRDGKIQKVSECSECGSDFHVEAHHDDYSKPLQVRWLCAACHKQWHALHGEAKNAA